MRTLLALAALLAAPALAQDARPTGEAKLAKMLEGRVPGKPVNCVPFTQLRTSTVVPGTAIVYRSVGSRLWVNRPRSGADALNDNDILVTRSTIGQLCSIDSINLIDRYSGFYRGTAVLDQFVPYERVRR